MSDEPDFMKLAEDCRALAEQCYMRLPDGGWRLKPEVVEAAYGEFTRLARSIIVGWSMDVAAFIAERSKTLPFLAEAGITEVVSWRPGHKSRVSLLKFDDGNHALLKEDRNPRDQPRWPLGYLVQPWWGELQDEVNYEIMPIGLVPMNYPSLKQAGTELSEGLHRFFGDIWRGALDRRGQLDLIPSCVLAKEGFLLLPDGTPYVFDPDEARDPEHRSEAEAINGLTTPQRQAAYAANTRELQAVLNDIFGGKPPFNYMAGDQTKLEHFFPIPAKLDVAIKAHQRAQMGAGPWPDGLEKSEP